MERIEGTRLWAYGLAIILVLLAGLACNDHELNPFGSTVKAGATDTTEQGEVRPIDILFVVDNSNSMCEEQIRLRDNFDDFITIMADFNVDFRLAVVNTDMVDPINGIGQFRKRPGTYIANASKCSETVPDTSFCVDHPTGILDKEAYPGLISADPTTRDDAIAKLQSDFACLALTGIDGDPVEMGLESMKSALGNNQVDNFLREDAFLAVIFVSDENDCSDGTYAGQKGPVYGQGDAACEWNRNVEDSCRFTEANPGGNYSFAGETKTGYEWCIDGRQDAVASMISGFAGESCAGDSCLKCGASDTECSSLLKSRRDYYQFLVDLMKAKNGYTGDDADAHAASDIIIATIVNEDGQVRYYNTEAVDGQWCGAAGTQGYRYELFAKMFPNQVIYPICDQTTGAPTNFADSLKAIADKIGQLINRVCLASPPMQCTLPAQPDGTCPDGEVCCPAGQTCNPQFETATGPFSLCSGFSVRVATIVDGQRTELAEGADYQWGIDTSCYDRTDNASPLLVSFTVPPPSGAKVEVSYPREVSSIY